jgi:flagellar hook-associated protein 2
VLTADTSGYDSRVQLSYGGSLDAATFNFATLNKDTLGAAMVDLTELDASYSVDGFALSSASNQATGVIDGLTLELKQIGSADLTVSRDTAKIKKSAEALVDAYNKLQESFSSLGSGDLQGESVVRSMQRQVRDIIDTPPTGLSGAFDALFQVGITTNGKTGQLEFDSTEFTAALDTDFSGVAQLFANDDQGYAFRFQALADSLLDTDGLLETREDGLNDRIKAVQADQESMEYRLEMREKSLRAQYATLDSVVGRLNSTSQFLFQQLNLKQ